MRELQTKQRQLAALQPVRRPDKSAIIKRIAESQKHVRRLDKEIWQLEHVTIHKAYNAMMEAQCKRDAGSNFFMRAWNRFYYGGDYISLTEAYEDVLKLKADKTKQRDNLIQRICRHPKAQAKASAEYARQAKEYQAYIRRKVELERDLQSAQRRVQAFKSALPQAQAQRRNDAGLHLSM
jgi:phage host-nuclease inhibitor protein Gam